MVTRSFFARLSPLFLLALLALPAHANERERNPGGWMGVLLGNAANRQAEAPAEGENPGVLVTGVVEDSPAADVGLRAQDRILTVDGVPVSSVSELVSRVSSAKPDTWIALEVNRDGRDRDMRLRLVERPERGSDLEMRRGWIGLQSIELPAPLREHFGAPEEAGVMVSAIEAGSPAEIAGIELGDVIYRIEETDITSGAELRRRIVRGGIGNVIEIEATRDGVEIVLEAVVEREPEPEPEQPRRDDSGRAPAPRRR